MSNCPTQLLGRHFSGWIDDGHESIGIEERDSESNYRDEQTSNSSAQRTQTHSPTSPQWPRVIQGLVWLRWTHRVGGWLCERASGFTVSRWRKEINRDGSSSKREGTGARGDRGGGGDIGGAWAGVSQASGQAALRGVVRCVGRKHRQAE